MNITITGNLGAGKTTVCRELKKLGYDTFSGGDIFRKVAENRGVSVTELNEMIKGDSTVDDEIDGMTARMGKETDHTVFDFRMGWHFIPDSYKVFLLVDTDIAAERVFHDNARSAEKYASVEEAKAFLQKRAVSEQERFEQLYGVDYYDADNYDLIIESSFATPAEIAKEIICSMKKYEAGDKAQRIELGIPGLYPTQTFRDFSEKRLNECITNAEEKDSLCVPSKIPVALKDGYCYILDGHHRVFGGARSGKKFADVKFDSAEASGVKITPLKKEDLCDFEDFGRIAYRSDTLIPKRGFLMDFHTNLPGYTKET